MLRKLSLLLLPTLFTFGIQAQEKETLVVVTRVAGDVILDRSDRKRKLQYKMILRQGDLIVSGKGKADIQIGRASVVRLQPNSSLRIATAIVNNEDSKTHLKIDKGSVFAKIFEKLVGDSFFRIQTPSAVAGVRATEFLVSNGSDEDSKENAGVFVKQGTVAISLEKGGQKRDFIATTNEQVLLNYDDAKKEILDNYMKQKLEILSGVKLMKEESFKRLERQRERSRLNLERIRKMNRENMDKMR